MRNLIVCLALVSCGQLEQKKESDKEASTDTTTVAPSDVQFSGYVQKAFTIKVNNKEFIDSEDFYTRFIDELVKPQYPDLKESDVSIEGKYGLEEFGSGSKVFMSSTLSEGHLYEGRTDGQSKFTVKVAQKALDETFKARVIVRIGLEVKKGDDVKRHCYILHGNKTDVAISESSKPIIFDDFSTQLTTYKCEEVNETLVIPGVEPGKSSDKPVADGTKILKTLVISTEDDSMQVDDSETELTGQLLTDGYAAYLVSIQRGRVILKKLEVKSASD